MATAAAPLFHSTKGTTNYASLCRLLVDVGAHILRETFDKRRPTGNLDAVLSSPPVHAVLRSLRHKRILNPSQWGKLYPAIKSAVSSNSFDISLLMVLLRKICGLAPPATGWDTPPPEADTTLEADIVRIKCYIYTVYSHASEASVDDPTFSQYWQDIQDALVRLGGAGYQSAIDDLKKEYMDPDLEEPYKQLLKQCVMCEVSIKERLYEIGKSEVELKKAAVNPEKKAGDKAIEVPKGKTDRDRKQDSSPANEEGEVPYYTGRKDLADIEDATVDTDDSEKTLIKSDKIGGKEDTWYLREAGASIKLCSGAVQQPAPFTCRCLLWNPRTRSPPIASDEILVSSVIEISHDGPPDLDYKKSFEGISFTLSLLHSAPYLEGYEVVIKQLTDQENNKWKELKTENTWHGSETSTVPKWLFPFAQAVCTKSAVSSFAAVWRPKSFTFSRGTAGGPELTCIVPDLPDVSVQIPQSCVPVYQDFCATIKVQEFPSSELKGEAGLVGPVIYISGSQNVSLIAPVTIRIPLTFRKEKQELAELRPGELRILQCEAHDWKDITDKLDEPPRLVDGKVQFKVRHFSGFRPIKLMRSLLQSTSGFTEFVGKLCYRSRPQHARFFTCLCETGVRGHFKLKLFCYPQRLYYDVIRKISECVVPYKDEGCSSKPVCGEEKILVSLSEAIIPQGTDQKNALKFVRFHENKVYYTGGEVCLGNESVPGVKFCDQNQQLLCNIIMVSIPVTSEFEEGSGISSQCVKHSIVKRPNSESSPCSPVAAPRKRIRQSAGVYLVKHGEPSNEELEYLSRELAGKWKTLGGRLGFSRAAIRNYDEDNPKLADKAFNMLIDWKQGQGSEATYTVLNDALCHKLVNCKLLAEQFCCDKTEGNASQGLRDFNKAVRKKLADEKHATVDYEENKKTLIKRGKLGGKEDTWHLREAGASIKLNSGAVQQPVPFTCTCSLWNPGTLSPPIASDEILVSSVIELSHDSPPDLEYRESVERLSFTIALLQSAPNLEGYEVVIKQLIDQENNEWKELKTENTWLGSETSTVRIPRWLFPFARVVCSKSGVSSFAAIWRPKSFTFSRGTAVGPELTCIVPDFPDVSVQIPQSCVPVNQDFCVTIQVQEFPSSKLKGEEGLVGPVLHISGTKNVTLIAPVTIRIPLILCKGKQELAELCPGELRILHCESLVEPHDWKDITDGLDEPPLLLDGKVQFKVKHLSRFRPVKLRTSRLKSASDYNAYVRKIRRRSRPQYAQFSTCLCKTSVPGHFGLKLFCYPPSLQYDVNRRISECVVPYKGEGSSRKPVCEEEKILVSLSKAIIPQGTDEKNALQFVRFRGNEVYHTGGEVCLGSVSVPKVKFNNRSQDLLCNVTMVLASQVPVTVDHEEGSDSLRGISAQSVKHSIVKYSNAESLSCSPAAASGKRKQYIYMVKDGKPSDRELEELSLKLGKKWKELGSCLEFDDAAITNLDEDNKKLARKAYRMLLAWKQRKGFQATYTVLYNALCDKLVECKLLAENFCCSEIEGNASP